jgi:hypothetical protein
VPEGGDDSGLFAVSGECCRSVPDMLADTPANPRCKTKNSYRLCTSVSVCRCFVLLQCASAQLPAHTQILPMPAVLDPDVGFAVKAVHYYEPLITFLQVQLGCGPVCFVRRGHLLTCRADLKRWLAGLRPNGPVAQPVLWFYRDTLWLVCPRG